MTPAPIQIRRAQPEDIPVLLRLLAHQLEQEQRRRLHPSAQHLERLLVSPSPPLQVLLAEIDRVPLGFLSFFSSYSGLQEGLRPLLRVDLLVVLSEARYGQVSAALIRGLAQIALAQGCYRIEGRFPETQHPALQSLRRMGARISAPSCGAWLDRVAIERLGRSGSAG